MSHLINRIVGWVKENQKNLVGRSNEVLRSSNSKYLVGYAVNTNQKNLVGYFIDGAKYGAFDSSWS